MTNNQFKQFLPLLLLAFGLAVILGLAEWAERFPAPPGPRETRNIGTTSGITFTPLSGIYADGINVEIHTQVAGAPIIYALNGVAPTATVGSIYTRPFRLENTAPGVTIIRAREFVTSQAGPLATAAYVVGISHTLPILSIAADPADLWSPETGILIQTWQRGDAWERPVDLTFFESDQVTFQTAAGLRYHDDGVFKRFWREKATGFETPPVLNLHGERPASTPKQNFRLYFRAAYGNAPELKAAIFADHPQQSPDDQTYRHLLLEAGDRTGRWTLIPELMMSQMADELGLPAARVRPTLLFLNDDSWGIYLLSERVDNFYTRDNFGIDAPDLIRSQKAREGTVDQWEAFIAWVKAHPLEEPAAYAYIRSQMDVDGFIDYAILRLYFGFPEDALCAVRAHNGGGRWFWIYGNSADWGGLLDPAHEPPLFRTAAAGEDFGLLLHSLLGNADFQAQFLARTEVLLNTDLAPATMHRRVDQFAVLLRPDLGYETARWPSLTAWESNVAALHDFVERRPALFYQQLTALFKLEPETRLALSIEPPTAGQIYLNGLPLTTTWEGHFNPQVELQAIAVPTAGHTFAGWSDGITATRRTIAVTRTPQLTARFVPLSNNDPLLRPNDVTINEYWINDNGTPYPSLEDRPLEGDWVELLIHRTQDLRGWRITDNDTKTGTGEGSLILPQLPVLAAVPPDTVILLIAGKTSMNSYYFPQDDLDPGDGRLIFYAGNAHLDTQTDPGFGLGTGRESLALLAPGATAAFTDDIGIDFVAEGNAVTPYTFGILQDGVRFDHPFHGLGSDDGLFFTASNSNDDGRIGWVVDPPPYQSGDAVQKEAYQRITPGALNEEQRTGLAALGWDAPIIIGLLILMAIAAFIVRRLRKIE